LPFVVTLGIPIALYRTRDTGWAHYRLAHAWLAINGQVVPWRGVCRASSSEHTTRDVLRRAGAGHKFRHERLRQHVLQLSDAEAPP
jgi:hypothetical protein